MTNAHWLIWVIFVFEFGGIIGLFCYRHSYPYNAGFLAVFTFAITLLMGIVAVSLHGRGQSDVVLMAWGLGLGLFVGLSIYAHVNPCNHDFASWGPILSGLLCLLLMWGLFIICFGTSYIMQKVYALFGLLIFMCFVMYDTDRLYKQWGPGDELVAAIELYLDVINIILYLMELLGRR